MISIDFILVPMGLDILINNDIDSDNMILILPADRCNLATMTE